MSCHATVESPLDCGWTQVVVAGLSRMGGRDRRLGELKDFVLHHYRSDRNPSRHGQQRDSNHQRPKAELKPAVFAIRRLGFDRLGLPGRIIPAAGNRNKELGRP